MSSGFQDPNKRYKVGRVLAEYELLELHEKLPELWRGTDREPLSLRDLAEEINIAIVRRAMENAGEEPLEGEAENAYRLLTDDEVSAGVRTQQRSQLQRDGVDVEQVESDFVTHQSVYTYLTKGLDISKERDENEDSIEKYEQRVERLRNRTRAVTETSLSELQNADLLTIGDFDVSVEIRVFCDDCGTQYELSDLIHNGTCECQIQE